MNGLGINDLNKGSNAYSNAHANPTLILSMIIINTYF